MCDAGVMAKHNPVPLGRWLRPRVEDERRTVPTSREEREGSFPRGKIELPKMAHTATFSVGHACSVCFVSCLDGSPKLWFAGSAV